MRGVIVMTPSMLLPLGGGKQTAAVYFFVVAGAEDRGTCRLMHAVRSLIEAGSGFMG